MGGRKGDAAGLGRGTTRVRRFAVKVWRATPHKKVVAVLAVASSVLTIWSFFLPNPFLKLWDGAPGAQSSSPLLTPLPPADPANSAATAAPSSDLPVSSGACLDQASALVSCNIPHRYELLSAGEMACNTAGVYRFLGGTENVDVLQFTTAAAQGGLCKVGAPVDTTGPFQQVTRGDASAVWRSCFDGEVESADRLYVDCLSPHTGEYISSPDRLDASSKSCLAAARDFLGVPVVEVDEELRVTPLRRVQEGIGQPRCAISVVSGQPLVNTLRRLGNELLPRHR